MRMKRWTVWFSWTIMLLIVGVGWAMDENIWKHLYLQGNAQRVTFLGVIEGKTGFWVGMPGELRSYDDEGLLKRPSFFLSGQASIFSIESRGDEVFAAASDGAYKIDLEKNEMKRIFSSSNEAGGQCWDIFDRDGRLYIATESGVFYSEDNGHIWQRLEGFKRNEAVFQIEHMGQYLYFSAGHTLYRLGLNDDRVTKVFYSGIEMGEQDFLNEESPTFDRDIRTFAVDRSREALAVVSSEGIFESHDAGENWNEISDQGVSVEGLNGILFLNAAIPCHGEGARSGDAIPQGVPPGPGFLAWGEQNVFVFCNGSWRPLYQGMPSLEIVDAVIDSAGGVLAATAEGVYRLVQQPRQALLSSPLQFLSEPSISDVQRMAVRYADMDPLKIQRWHRQSRMKALVPSFSLGVDRNATDLWHWDTGQNPDEMIKGREITEWDVSLNWDLSEMIWSSDQTSIDSRSKLLTELREDVLSQVTRIYFERRRLQMEQERIAEEERAWTQLRIDELTALLDAYTGGAFSVNMEK